MYNELLSILLFHLLLFDYILFKASFHGRWQSQISLFILDM